MEPATFAAELISRLEKLKLEMESRHSLEERLQQIREVAGAGSSPAPPRATASPLHQGRPSASWVTPLSPTFRSRMKRRTAPSWH